MHFGKVQLAVMRTVAHGDRWIVNDSGSQRQKACLALHQKGLLVRDPKNSYRWTATEKGTQAIIEHDAALPRPRDPMDVLKLEDLVS